jgi:osmotically-inducible protein OsmY
MRKFLFALFTGAALAYYLDSDRGAYRRNVSRDKLLSTFRRFGNRSEKLARFAGGQAYGVVQETVHLRPKDNPNPDDNTLRDRVESELFRDPGVPKGEININVVAGIVELRGELQSQGQIDTVVQRVQSIDGVRGVHNYLHLPGTPAPNKASVINVS